MINQDYVSHFVFETELKSLALLQQYVLEIVATCGDRALSDPFGLTHTFWAAIMEGRSAAKEFINQLGVTYEQQKQVHQLAMISGMFFILTTTNFTMVDLGDFAFDLETAQAYVENYIRNQGAMN